MCPVRPRTLDGPCAQRRPQETLQHQGLLPCLSPWSCHPGLQLLTCCRPPASWLVPIPVCSLLTWTLLQGEAELLWVEQRGLDKPQTDLGALGPLCTCQGGCCVAQEQWPDISEPPVPPVYTGFSCGQPRGPTVGTRLRAAHGHPSLSVGRWTFGVVRAPPVPAPPLPAPRLPAAPSSSRLRSTSVWVSETGLTASAQPLLGSWAGGRWRPGPLPRLVFPSSPGAEWRQPPRGGLAGAGQGLAPRSREEQEVPGRAGRC